MRDATRVIRAGRPQPKQGECLLPGPAFASIFHCSGDPESSPYTYGRFHNPTWTVFENALQELEKGPAISFASGMAAVAAVLGVVLGSGDVLVIPEDCYYTTRIIAREYLEAHGVQVRLCPTRKPDWSSLLEGADLLWLETPSNPELAIYDIAQLAQAAHGHGALLAVDNTASTPLIQRPLELGADFSVASDSKALAGHGDLILGHVAVRGSEWAEFLRTWRTRMGAVPGPMEVWLAHRSLASLDLRLQRMCANAARIARMLANRSEVKGVLYPGLEGHPGHEIATRQMNLFGHIVCFELADKERARAFLRTCRLVDEATSFGGLQSTAERRARWGGDKVSGGFIRMSVGCEHPEDLEEDLMQALEGKYEG